MHLDAVEKLIHGTVEKVILDDEYYNLSNNVNNIEKQLSETKFKLGMEYANNGKKKKH
ncbi:hypothetical protein GCM10009865_43250 [Aeromicrobium ponti]